MAKYRKKPLEAVQWFKNGDDPDVELCGELSFCFYDKNCSHCGNKRENHGWMEIGGHRVCPGDWIIRVPGRPLILIVKPDIFEATYEKVE